MRSEDQRATDAENQTNLPFLHPDPLPQIPGHMTTRALLTLAVLTFLSSTSGKATFKLDFTSTPVAPFWPLKTQATHL